MWVKICGVCNVESARIAASSGADAVGLNFYPKSPRCVTRAVAAAIAASLPAATVPVGLFVNHTQEEIASIAAESGLSTVQLHGDESPEFLAELAAAAPELKLIRALRVGEEGLAEVERYLERCRKLGVTLTACLIDAYVPGVYGGSGRPVPHELFQHARREEWPPLILAGGLNPENVANAVRTVRPWGVDTASGVESSPGVKDPERIRQFIQAARGNESFPTRHERPSPLCGNE